MNNMLFIFKVSISLHSSRRSRKEENPYGNILRGSIISLMCHAGMPLPMLLQTCWHNFLDRVEVRMGDVKAHTWKELVEQAEIAAKSAKIFELLVPKNKWWGSTTRDVMQPNLHSPRGKKQWQLSCLGKFHQSKRGATRISSFCQDNTPSKMNRWWLSSTYWTRVISLIYQKFSAPTKLNVKTTPTAASFIGWCIIPPADALSSRTSSKH